MREHKDCVKKVVEGGGGIGYASRMDSRFARGLFLALCFLPLPCRAGVVVEDDLGNRVRLERPVQRIVSLAPNITEILYAAGAGEKLVGAVEYSDYPAAARRILRVGSSQAFDVEKIAALHPDIVFAWKSGNPAGLLDQLETLGIRVVLVEPPDLPGIAKDIRMAGEIAGTDAIAEQSASAFLARYRELKEKYSGRRKVKIFYEIWNDPLMTVSQHQFIGEAMHLCGAIDVFGNLPSLVSTVSVEAVLAAGPEAIVASGMGNVRPSWLDEWKKWDGFSASRHLYFVPADLINRAGPRLLDGVEMLCGEVEAVRKGG